MTCPLPVPHSWESLQVGALPTDSGPLEGGVSGFCHDGWLVAPSGKCSALGTL